MPRPPADDSPPAGTALPADQLLSELHRAHALKLIRVATLLLGDQPSAEDVVQDAFLGLYRALPGLRDRSKALPYLRKPRYYAAVAYGHHTAASTVDIVNAATGRVTGQLGSPRHGMYFQEVASLGSDRSFVAAAAVPLGPGFQSNCHTWLYRFRITPAGRPG